MDTPDVGCVCPQHTHTYVHPAACACRCARVCPDGSSSEEEEIKTGGLQEGVDFVKGIMEQLVARMELKITNTSLRMEHLVCRCPALLSCHVFLPN